MAVEVIMTLEQQVRGKQNQIPQALFPTPHQYIHGHPFHIPERNLNPKAACLKRREEEKSDDGPKLPSHHMLSNAAYPAMPVSNISFDF